MSSSISRRIPGMSSSDNRRMPCLPSFNLDWKFHLGDVHDAWQKDFDDSSWRVVTLPHDWSVEHPFDIRNSSGTGYLPGGTAFYRKTFKLPSDTSGNDVSVTTGTHGKDVRVTFDGVYKNAKIWINGNYLGYRPYGYSTFSFDISDFCVFGDDSHNVLAVRVEHEDIADSRWFTGSGIYRKVALSVRGREHIKENGVFIRTGIVGAVTCSGAGDGASAGVATLLADVSTTAVSACEIHCLLYDAAGRLVASEKADADGGGGAAFALTVENPCLWSPDNPYNYSATIELRRNGELLDTVTIRTGIRSFSFNADSGFSLNGVPMKLKGVCVHHDAGCLGAAVPAAVWRDRLLTFKSIGANALRTSHNPPMPELLDLCDELGFLVIDEAFDEWEGCKNKWSTGHNVYPPKHFGYSEHFPEWHGFDLSAMVLRDRNHPSVIMWSVGNEIDYPNDPYCHPLFKTFTGNNDANKPKAEMMYNPAKPNAERLPVIARELVGIIKRLDASRPVSAAVAFPELSDITGYSGCFDVIGYNYKETLYADIHAAHPEWIIFGSENGHGYSEWLCARDNRYIAGQFLWTGVDFLGETKLWPCHGSHAGLLDLAGNMKPVAHYRRAMWSECPVAKLFARDDGDWRDGHTEGRDERTAWRDGHTAWRDGHTAWRDCWNFTDGAGVEVTCYTNGREASLYLDGRPVGRKTVECCIAAWKLPYAPGTLRVETDNGASDNLATVSAPVGIRLECRNAAMLRADGEDAAMLRTDGQDIAILHASIVDREGHVVSDAAHELFVEVTGGMLLGLENGDLSDTREYALPSRHAFNGRLAIYARAGDRPGTMRVCVTSPKLRGAYMDISIR